MTKLRFECLFKFDSIQALSCSMTETTLGLELNCKTNNIHNLIINYYWLLLSNIQINWLHRQINFFGDSQIKNVCQNLTNNNLFFTWQYN